MFQHFLNFNLFNLEMWCWYDEHESLLINFSSNLNLNLLVMLAIFRILCLLVIFFTNSTFTEQRVAAVNITSTWRSSWHTKAICYSTTWRWVQRGWPRANVISKLNLAKQQNIDLISGHIFCNKINNNTWMEILTLV